MGALCISQTSFVCGIPVRVIPGNVSRLAGGSKAAMFLISPPRLGMLTYGVSVSLVK